MSPSIKSLWVAALRSGEYKKAKRRLRRGNRFCATGILCDLHSKATGTKWTEDGAYLTSYAVPDCSVKQWAGLKDGELTIDIGDELDGVAGHNDNGRTFAEIADAIEEQL